MAYIFATEELEQIRQVSSSIEVEGSEVPWWALYQEVSTILQAALVRGSVASEDIKDAEAAMLWFDGAVQVNKGEGAFSTFIREYTARQFQLRYGSSSMDEVVSKMQAVSDAIAVQVVVNDILNSGGVLPTMKQLANSDATIAGQMLFSSLGSSDSAAASNSGWSGAILFSMFGEDQSNRLLSGGDRAKLDTLEDLRDVLYSIESFYAAINAAFAGSLGGLVGLPPTTIMGWRDIFVDGEIFWRALEARGEPYEFYSHVRDELLAGNDFAEAVLKTILKGEDAESAVSAIFSYGGVGHVLSAVQSARYGYKVDELSEDEVLPALQGFFSAIKDADQGGLQVQLVSDFGGSSGLLAAANQDNDQGMAVRNALKFLSPVVVFNEDGFHGRGLELYNEETGQGSINQEWLTDRIAMLESFIAIEFSGGSPQSAYAFADIETNQHTILGPASTDNGAIVFGRLTETNTGENAIYGSVKNDRLYGGSKEDLILGGELNDTLYGMGGGDTLKGEGGSDYIEGGGGNDHLYGDGANDTLLGGVGDDILEGGAGSDNLNGGKGNDTYVIDGSAGFDVIEDGDGGIIKFNEHVLSGGKATGSGGDQWKDDYVTYTKLEEGGVTSLVISVGGNTVKILNWENGGFGINLLDADPPSAIPADRTIYGDLRRKDFDPRDPEYIDGDYHPNIEYRLDDIGNYITEGAAPDAQDWQLRDGAGNDRIYSLGGDDYVYAEKGGNDLIDGGEGDDLLNDISGNDTLIGGGGSDRLFGQFGDDKLYASQEVEAADAFANNELENGGTARGEMLDGGVGSDLVVGWTDQDILLGYVGRDTLLGGAGDDVLLGDSRVLSSDLDWKVIRSVTEGDAITYYSLEYEHLTTTRVDTSDSDADFLYGGAGDDWMFGQHDKDFLDGGKDNDVLFGGADNDILIGGAGNDVLTGDDGATSSGNDGSDYLLGGVGDDTLSGDGGDDILEGNADNDYLSGDNSSLPADIHGDDHLDGGSGDDFLWGDGGNDTLEGGAGHDELQGDNSGLPGELHGHDLLNGGSGNDSLWGGGGNDTLRGGEDNDYLEGDSSLLDVSAHGNDAIYGEKGNDTIAGGGGNDKLFGDDDDDQLSGETGADTLQGGAGNDSLWGGEGNDVIHGGSGFDYLDGGAGNDIYLLNSGDGGRSPEDYVESIRDTLGDNTIEFGAGVSEGSVLLEKVANGLLVKYGISDELLLHGGLGDATKYLKFSSGKTYGLKEFYARYSQDDVNVTSFTPGSEMIGSATSNELVAAGGGAIFRGGRGNDTLIADGGGNTYLYERGDGDDHIFDDSHLDLGGGQKLPNKISFGPGIYLDQISLAIGSVDTLEIRVAGNNAGKIVIHNVSANRISSGNVIELFEFSDGHVATFASLLGTGISTTGNSAADLILGSDLNDSLKGLGGADTLSAGSGDDTLEGGLGDDLIEGGLGADVYIYKPGHGVDTIVEHSDAAINTIRFGAGIALSDVELTADASGNLLLGLAGGEDGLVLKNWLSAGSALVQRFEFNNGDLLTSDEILQQLKVLYGTNSNDTMNALSGQAGAFYGLDGNDSVTGSSLNDTIVGGFGADTLVGGAGNDLYLFGVGDGNDQIVDSSGVDRFEFGSGIAPEDIVVRHSGNDLVLSRINTQDSITIKNWYASNDGGSWIEEVVFAGGSVWTASQLTAFGLTQMGTVEADTLIGVELYVDSISGGAGNDSISGLGGADVLNGDFGNDTLNGGDGADLLSGGDGNDRIDAGAGDDVIYGGSGDDNIFTRTGSDFVYAGEGNDSITVQGTAIVDSGAGNDRISADNGIQFTIKYSTGYGEDDHNSFARIEFLGFDREDFRYLRSGNNLMMVGQANSADKIWQSNFFLSSAAQSKASFFSMLFDGGQLVTDIAAAEVGGVYLDARRMSSDYGWEAVRYNSTNYSPSADSLGQYSRVAGGGFFLGDSKLSDDWLIGSDLADTIKVQAGNDVVYGMSGADSISLLAGDDTVSGGVGNDSLNIDGVGQKTLVFSVGDGADTISQSYDAGLDIRVSGFDFETVRYERFGSDVKLVFFGSADSILLKGFLDVANLQVSQKWLNDKVLLAGDQVITSGEILAGVLSAENAPIAEADSFSMTAGQVLILTPSDLLQNDSDVEANSYYPIYLAGVAEGEGGVVFKDDSNNIVFIPNPGFYGYARFTYGVSDYIKTSVGVASVSVGKTYEILAAGSTVITAAEVLRDDLILDNDSCQIGLISSSENVDVQFDSVAGIFTIRPAEGFVGRASFTYGWHDGMEYRYAVADLFVDSAVGVTLNGTSASDYLDGHYGNDTINGAGSNDYLFGYMGDDRLVGGAGKDVMIGGKGNDVYVVDNLGDLVIEGAGEGVDAVESSITWTLSTSLENLVLSGTSSINGTGNDLNNVLTGNSGGNTLIGGAGNDRLDGKTGADSMQGGLGNDTYVVERSSDVVVEIAGEGLDTVESSVTLTLGDNIENLTLTGTSALNGTGNALDNTLLGNSAANTLTGAAGSDRLDGGSGNDTMRGGAGDDTYVVNTTSDVVTENASEGIDTIESSVTLTLGSNIENLILTGTSALNGTGNTLNNSLRGNLGANSLTGGAGNDRLDGLGAADSLTGGAGNDTYVFGRGYGADTAVENDATAGNADIAQFLEGIGTDQLWFRRLSNNLEVSIIGTSDKLTVKDWYLGNAYHVEQFKTADGKTLLDSQVQNLVNAMAGFAPPSAGQTTLPENYQTALSSVIATNWQ